MRAQPPFGFPDVVIERDRDRRRPPADRSRPIVETDGSRLWRSSFGPNPAERSEIDRRDRRVRNLAIAGADGVGEIGQRGNDVETGALGRAVSPQPRTRRSESCCGFRRAIAPSSSSARTRSPRSSTTRRLAEPALHRSRHRAPAMRIAFTRPRCSSSVCILRKRHEDGANGALARAERKLAEIVAREHLRGRSAARCGRHPPSCRAATRSESPTSSRREGSPTGRHRSGKLGGKRLRSAAPRSRRGAFTRSRPWKRQNRSSTPYTCTRDARRPLSCSVTNPSATTSGTACSNAPASCSRKNPCDTDDAIGPAEPLQHEVAQARAHRDADHQRAGEHRDRNGDAADDREIRAPVMTQAAATKSAGLHRQSRPRAAACDRPDRSGWESARRARRCA